MPIPEPFRPDAAKLPSNLRTLLEGELAVGNKIVSVIHGHPAPPTGAVFMLARPVTTRLRASGDGIKFRAVDSSLYAGEFSDADRIYFITEAPNPPPSPPDMDAIRAAANAPRPKPKQEITPKTLYLIELDYKGEMLTYSEHNRRVNMFCSIGNKTVLEAQSLRDWWYPDEKRSQAMSGEEKERVIQCFVEYCYRNQGVTKVIIEDEPAPGPNTTT